MKVFVRKSQDGLETAIKQFKRKVRMAGILDELKNRVLNPSKGDRRRSKDRRAVVRRKKGGGK